MHIFRSAQYGCPSTATNVHLYQVSSRTWVISSSTSRVAKLLAVWGAAKRLVLSYILCSRTEKKGNSVDHAIGPFQPMKDDGDSAIGSAQSMKALGKFAMRNVLLQMKDRGGGSLNLQAPCVLYIGQAFR